MAQFWDTHSTADYHDLAYEVEMTFDPLASSSSVGIEPELLSNLRQVGQYTSGQHLSRRL